MLDTKKAVLFALLCASKAVITKSIQCKEVVKGTSGYMTFEADEFVNGLNMCWNIYNPEGSYISLEVEKFLTYDRNCDTAVAIIEISERSGTAKQIRLCPGKTELVLVDKEAQLNISLSRSRNYYSTTRECTFLLRYRSESKTCLESDIFRCSSTVCIPRAKLCDGIKDCYNGFDEEKCASHVVEMEGVEEIRLHTIQWLISKRLKWKKNTHRAIIALYLASERMSEYIDELMIKQLETETLTALLRNGTDPLSTNQLSMFINALLVTCRNPRNFYGFDLVKLLKDQVCVTSLTSLPIVYLALCNAKESLNGNATNDLNKIIMNKTKYPFLVDIQASAVIAKICIGDLNQENLNVSEIHSNFQRIVDTFKKLQSENGSFGNIYTTALLTQVLLSYDRERHLDWKLNSTVSYLKQYLNSSADLLSSYLALPVLNGKTLLDAREGDCSNFTKDIVTDNENKLVTKMQVHYSLYIGDAKEVIYSISIKVPQNISAYGVMQLAEAMNNKFKFRWTRNQETVFIYEIANITNDYEDGKFWFLYVGEEEDTIEHSTESPDKVIMPDRGHLVMWYTGFHV